MTTYEITPPPTRLADRVQVRLGFSKNQGTVTRFMVQLEYWLEDDWCAVVRYDHDQEALGGHNITEEGLYRDVYREGEKIGTVQVTNPIPANESSITPKMTYARTSNDISRGSNNGTTSGTEQTCERRRI